MWSVARRPRWIAMLVLALAMAAGFAALGQWQLERSIASGTVVERETETVMPLTDLAEPQQPVTESVAGHLVTATGNYVDGDYSLLSGRINGGATGYWVVGHFQTDAAGSSSAGGALAVALGWAPTEEAAASVLEGLSGDRMPSTVTGRYVAPDSPQETDFENGERSVMSPAALINEWSDFGSGNGGGDVYGGYLVSSADIAGLDLIDSPVPTSEVSLNWLNLFYAAEWVVFAGFAVFMWYRLVKDAWEREVELAEEAAATAVVPGQQEVRLGAE